LIEEQKGRATASRGLLYLLTERLVFDPQMYELSSTPADRRD
jgi:hypothetical protein